MISLGFTSTPSLLQSIRSQRQQLSTNLCHRNRIFLTSQTASTPTLRTVLCAHSELPRKRGRPKGSKNRAKSGKAHEENTNLKYPVKGKPTKGTDEQIVGKPTHRREEIEKQPRNLGQPQPADSDQRDKRATPEANGRKEPAPLFDEKRRTNNGKSQEVEKSHAPGPPRKRGRPQKPKFHDTLSTEHADHLGSRGTKSQASVSTERRSIWTQERKHASHHDVTTISSSEGDATREPLDVPDESDKSQAKKRRGRPPAITSEVEQLIIARSQGSKTGESQKAPTKKRGRGRPRGSKNKPKRTAFDPKIGLERLREDAFADAERDDQMDVLDWFEMYNNSRVEDFRKTPQQDRREKQLRAPNGLPGSGPDDFISELMPLIAKMEAEQNRVVSEKERTIRRFIDKAFHQFASSHRSDRRQLNLKPFKLREDKKKVCTKCEGLRNVTCEYCQGYGYLDLGENAERFCKEFDKGDKSSLKQIMGTLYQCPNCDGIGKHECEHCSGTGRLKGQFPRKPGASRTPINNYAIEEFDLEQFLESENDRIHIGLDGTIILRARRRRRKRNVESTESRREKSEFAQSKEQSGPQGLESTSPGNPSQKVSPAMSRLREFLRKKGNIPLRDIRPLSDRESRVNSRRTNFVNTTDYKVARNLREQKTRFSSTNEITLESNNDDGDKLQKKTGRL